MSTKLEQWRQADRQAHSAEIGLWALGVRHQPCAPQADEVAAAKALRRVADRLFDEAMEELRAQIAGNRSCRPQPVSH